MQELFHTASSEDRRGSLLIRVSASSSAQDETRENDRNIDSINREERGGRTLLRFWLRSASSIAKPLERACLLRFVSRSDEEA